MAKSFVDKRRDEIVKLLREGDEVAVADLAEHFGTSPLTIRRDLDYLQGQGILLRSYGTAHLTETYADASGSRREQAKQSIARHAAGLIEDGDTVFINTSSTALAVIDFISAHGVTIVTNNGRVLGKTIPSNITVILTGGEVRVPKWSMTGDFTLDTIAQIKAPKSILGCSGISVQRGLTTIVAQEMRINALMLEQSEQRIIVVDSSKLGKDSSFKYGDIGQIDKLITDRNASDDQISSFRSSGVGEVIEVEIA